MKKASFLLLINLLLTAVSSQEINRNYDSTLAASLGADDYGMKQYVLVILKTGKINITDTALRAQFFRGHFENIHNLSSQGKLVVAGPLEKNDHSYRGIFILDVTDFAEAKNLLRNDPVIKEGLMDAELYKWYGSAALGTYLEIHEKIQRISIQ